MKTKLFLLAISLVAMLSACEKEDIVAYPDIDYGIEAGRDTVVSAYCYEWELIGDITTPLESNRRLTNSPWGTIGLANFAFTYYPSLNYSNYQITVTNSQQNPSTSGWNLDGEDDFRLYINVGSYSAPLRWHEISEDNKYISFQCTDTGWHPQSMTINVRECLYKTKYTRIEHTIYNMRYYPTTDSYVQDGAPFYETEYLN